MRVRRALIVEQSGERVLLRAPNVGWFSHARVKGQVLAPDAVAGLLETLGTHQELIVPAGVFGRVANVAPERALEPVEYGQILYELEALDGVSSFESVKAQGAVSGLVVRAPFAGRFWQRPSPSEPAFAEVGEEIAEGRTVGLLEVMKTFSHVHYGGAAESLPASARFVRYVTADGAEVSAGDALLLVENAT